MSIAIIRCDSKKINPAAVQNINFTGSYVTDIIHNKVVIKIKFISVIKQATTVINFIPNNLRLDVCIPH